jgi:TRAP-type C4-dicarboxylate transport system substrate-binding protein
MRRRNRLAAALVLAAAFLFSAADSRAQTFKITLGASHSPNLPFVGLMGKFVKPEVDKRIKAAGLKVKVQWTEAYSGALYTFQGTLEGVQEGLADIGWVGAIWEASKMPLQQISYVTTFVTEDPIVIADVMNELHDKVPALRKNWQDNNQIFLGSTSIGAMMLYTTFPVNKVSDLKGRKINVAGMGGNWLRNTGGVPIDGGIPVFHNNVKNGIAEGVLLTAGTGFSIKLHKVAPYITRIGIGALHVGGLTVNKDTWNKMPPGLQKILRDVGREYSKKVATVTAQTEAKALQKMIKDGAKVSDLSQAERKKWIKLLPNLAKEWAADSEKRGFPGKLMLTSFMDAMRARGQKPLRDWDKEF